MLLPIQDSVGGALAFKVYERVEQYLKDGDWCYFRNNSEIINILGNYRRNLKGHLNNPKILKILAEKTKAGSLLKIEIQSEVKGAFVDIQVFGENGEDIYFKERTRLESDDVDVIAQTISNWLDVYEKTIPYDGRIIGVLGNQFTVDMGKDSGVRMIDNIEIVRPVKKRKHPLLKEIVDWDTKRIGQGRLFHITRSQSQGKLRVIEKRQFIKLNDWVRIRKNAKSSTNDELKYTEVRTRKTGQLGIAKVLLNLGTGTSMVKPTSGNLKKVGGLVGGVGFRGEMWATRNFWVGAEFDQNFSTYKRKEGTLNFSSNSASMTSYRFKVGYKYLPLGFFYGPQVDAYAGYGSYGYGLDAQDGFVDVTFSGFCMGFRGSMPLKQKMRIFLELEFLFSGSYDEAIPTYGDADSVSTYVIHVGGSYMYNSKISFEGTLNIASSKATFDASSAEQIKNGMTSLMFGTIFNF